jgi:hypothetical protein
VEQNEFELMLQRIYYNPNCQYVYIGLLVSSLALVVITIWKGVLIDENPLFLAAECLINVCILVDFFCRLRLQGAHKFLEGGFYNVLDATVAIGCIFLFVMLFLSQSGYVKLLEEVSEELFLICWSTFQSLRMILIAKKQNLAQQSAKTLIDISSVIDTDYDDSLTTEEAEEVIVFDMKKIEQRQNSIVGSQRSNSLVKRNRTHKRQRSQGGMHHHQNQSHQNLDDSLSVDDIEMQDMSRVNGKDRGEVFNSQGLAGYTDDDDDIIRVAVNHHSGSTLV